MNTCKHKKQLSEDSKHLEKYDLETGFNNLFDPFNILMDFIRPPVSENSNTNIYNDNQFNTDIVKFDDHVLVKMEIPGWKKSQLDINISKAKGSSNNAVLLSIKGNKQVEKEVKDESDGKSEPRLITKQISTKLSFSEILLLPIKYKDIDFDNDDNYASIEDGVLSIKISTIKPKYEELDNGGKYKIKFS